jgi:MFS family permease
MPSSCQHCQPLFCLCCCCLCSYLTFAIGTVAEVVALLVVGPTVDRLGRHNIVALGQLLGGGACVACAMVSGGTTQAVMAAIGKFGCSGGLK